MSSVFRTGGRVGRGQALFRLDDAEHRHRVERARAVVAVQEVELLKVEEEARIARDQYERFRRRQPADSPVANTGPLALWEPQLRAARAAVDRDRTALAEAELGFSRTVVRAPFAGVVRDESVDVGRFVTAGEPVGRSLPPTRWKWWSRSPTPMRRSSRACGTCGREMPIGGSPLASSPTTATGQPVVVGGIEIATEGMAVRTAAEVDH